MNVAELIVKLRKYPANSKVELVIVRGDERIYTEPGTIAPAKDYRGRLTVEISNEV